MPLRLQLVKGLEGKEFLFVDKQDSLRHCVFRHYGVGFRALEQIEFYGLTLLNWRQRNALEADLRLLQMMAQDNELDVIRQVLEVLTTVKGERDSLIALWGD